MKAISKLIVAAAVAMSPLSIVAASAKDTTIPIATGDSQMNAAIAKARATLPLFWARFAEPSPGLEDFALKVAIRDGDKVEHFWLTGIRREGKKISGDIANDPHTVLTVKLGQRYDIPEKDISDWSYQKDGIIFGNYTLLVLLDHMPAAEAAAYRARLAPE